MYVTPRASSCAPGPHARSVLPWTVVCAGLLASCAAPSPVKSAGPPAPGPRPTATVPDAPAQADAPPGVALGPDSELDDYLRWAALHSPEVESAWQSWIAAVERIDHAAVPPNPRVTLRHFLEEVETRVGPQENAIGVSQSWPWPGTLGLRGDVAEAEAAAAAARFEGVKQDLFARVKKGWADLYYLGRAIDVVRRNRELVSFFEGVARARYRAAAADHPDVVRAQLELFKLDDRLRELEDRRAPLAARLNAELHRAPDAAIAWPAHLPLQEIDLPDSDSARTLRGWIAESHPELQALEHETRRSEHAVELAKKNARPDLTFGLEWIDTGSARGRGVSGSGDDPLIVSLGVSVPVWRGALRSEEREARARHRATVLHRDALLDALVADLETTLFELRDAQRKIGLYRDTLVPKANEALRVTETAFRAGTSTFLDLVDAERSLLEFELGFEAALRNHAKNLAELERIAGRPLPIRTPDEGAPEQPSDAGGSDDD